MMLSSVEVFYRATCVIFSLTALQCNKVFTILASKLLINNTCGDLDTLRTVISHFRATPEHCKNNNNCAISSNKSLQLTNLTTCMLTCSLDNLTILTCSVTYDCNHSWVKLQKALCVRCKLSPTFLNSIKCYYIVVLLFSGNDSFMRFRHFHLRPESKGQRRIRKMLSGWIIFFLSQFRNGRAKIVKFQSTENGTAFDKRLYAPEKFGFADCASFCSVVINKGFQINVGMQILTAIKKNSGIKDCRLIFE